MEKYFIFLLFNNVVGAFILYKIYTAFYEGCRLSKKLEILIFTVIQILLLGVYLAQPPTYMMTGANLVLYGGYSFLYSKSIKKNLIVVSGIFAVQIALEAIAYSLFMYTGIGIETTVSYQSTAFVITSTTLNMMRFIFMIALRRWMKTYTEYTLPTRQWLCLFLPPTASIVLMLILPRIDGIPESLFLGLALFCMSITIPVFILFDTMSQVMLEQMSHQAFEENQKYYENQLLLMKAQVVTIQTLKHDLKNKLTPLYLYAEAEDMEGVKNKLSEILGVCKEPIKYAHTGSVDIDSIINFKLSLARELTDQVNTEILIPKDLHLPDFDLAVILGNLLDNAIEGMKTSKQNQSIQVKMTYSKGRIMIRIENSFDGIVAQKGSHYITRKENAQEHGLGLKSVQSILEKYQGVLKLKHTEETFIAKALLYVE